MEIRSYPNIRSFYANQTSSDDRLLQGDGWRGFVAIDFHSAERKPLSGIVLSNSCDVDTQNRRALVPSILFAPLIRLDRYCESLAEAGDTEIQIESIRHAIRAQEATSIFHLPAPDQEAPERMALLYDVHQHPLDDFLSGERSCIFTLSQVAFYLFLVKLSIHFLRMQEGVER